MASPNIPRRRAFGDSRETLQETTTDLPPIKGERIELVPASKLEKLSQKKGRRWQWLVFGLGGLFGLLIAAFFAQQHDVINLEGLMDVKFESLLDAIPAGIVKDAREITVSPFL